MEVSFSSLQFWKYIDARLFVDKLKIDNKLFITEEQVDETPGAQGDSNSDRNVGLQSARWWRTTCS